jgi:hypothetical protein
MHEPALAWLGVQRAVFPRTWTSRQADLTLPDLVRAAWAKHEADLAAGIEPVYDNCDDDC